MIDVCRVRPVRGFQSALHRAQAGQVRSRSFAAAGSSGRPCVLRVPVNSFASKADDGRAVKGRASAARAAIMARYLRNIVISLGSRTCRFVEAVNRWVHVARRRHRGAAHSAAELRECAGHLADGPTPAKRPTGLAGNPVEGRKPELEDRQAVCFTIAAAPGRTRRGKDSQKYFAASVSFGGSRSSSRCRRPPTGRTRAGGGPARSREISMVSKPRAAGVWMGDDDETDPRALQDHAGAGG